MFSRSVGEDEEKYRQADVDGPPANAPLTFVEAGAHFDPSFPSRPRRGERWFGSGSHPTGIPADDPRLAGRGSGSRLHAEQHFVYHRPVRVGDVLTVTTRSGRTRHKARRTGGTLELTESVTEYRDEGGDLVVTATKVVARIDDGQHG